MNKELNVEFDDLMEEGVDYIDLHDGHIAIIITEEQMKEYQLKPDS